MKREYVTPTIACVEMDPVDVLTVSGVAEINDGIGSGDGTEDPWGGI